MNFGNTPESTNTTDDIHPGWGQYLKTQVGAFLLKHGIVNNAAGHPYQTPYNPSMGPQVPLNANGQRSDIDWNSNQNLPGVAQSFMAAHNASQNPNDAMAKKLGFKDAATAAAYYQKQQEMRTGPAGGASASSGGSLLDRVLAIHPAVMLGHVLDAWNKADGTTP
jgi:hypothetical protein